MYLQGKTPPIQVALDLCHILSGSGTNLRQPVSLESQLLADQRMDSDVSKSMLQLLQVFPAVSQPFVLVSVFALFSPCFRFVCSLVPLLSMSAVLLFLLQSITVDESDSSSLIAFVVVLNLW